jgi:hypothetical protein
LDEIGVYVIPIKVAVTDGMNEAARTVAGDLGDHHK